MCTLTCVHSYLKYLLVFPTFLSYSFFHSLDIPTAVTSKVKYLYGVTGTVDVQNHLLFAQFLSFLFPVQESCTVCLYE